MNRRRFLLGLAAGISAAGLSACGIPTPSGPTSTPTVSPSPLPSPTLSPTPRPTSTPTPTSTATSTPTSTPTPALAGTPQAPIKEGMSETNLVKVVEMSRWGRGMTRDLSWSPDGSLLAAATDLGVYLYKPDTLALQTRLDRGYTHRLAFSPDSKILATAGYELILWDISTSNSSSLGRIAQPYALRFSADGSRLGLISQNNADPIQFEIWDVQHAARLEGASLNDSSERISAAALSPDLAQTAAHSQKGTVKLWHKTGVRSGEIPSTPSEAGPLVFAPDGKSIAVGYPDFTFNFKNSNRIRVFTLGDVQSWHDLYPEGGVEGSTEKLLNLAYSPDGLHLAAGYANRIAKIWRSEPGPVERTLAGSGIPSALAFSPDSLHLAGGGMDIWQVKDATLIRTLPEHFTPFDDIAVSPDGELAVLAGGGQVQVRYIPDGSILRMLENPPAQVVGLSFSPDGLLLSGAGSDGTARLWRLRDGRYLTLIGGPTRRMWATAFSPDGKLIVLAGEDGLVQIYDIEKDLITIQVKEPYVATRLVFSPVGTLFVSMTTSGANIRDLQGALTRDIAGLGLQDAAFSPDGSRLALAGSEILRVIDVGTGKDVYRLYDPSRGQPSALAFSPEGAFLAVGRGDGSIDLFWAADGTFLHTLTGHRGIVTRLAFTPASRQLVSTAQDGTVRIWGVVS